MKKPIIWWWLSFGVLLSAIAGCAADQAALDLAKETLAQTVKYEQTYRDSHAAFDRYLLTRISDSQLLLVEQRKVAAYEELAALTEITSERLVKRGYSAERVRTYLNEARDVVARHRTEGDDSIASLKTLRSEVQARTKSWLSASQQVRVRLEKLATPRNAKQMVQLLKPYAKAVADGLPKPE